MNRVIKSAIGVAIAAASSGAYAQMAPISSGGSDLVLWVQGTNTSGTTSTYAFDTGLSISSIFGTTFTPGASLTPLPGPNDTFSNIGSGSSAGTLASFMSTFSQNQSWTLEGGFYNNPGALANTPNTKTAGAAEAIFTSQFQAASGTGVTALQLNGMQTLLNGFSASGGITGGGGLDGLVTLFSAAGANGATTQGSWTAADQSKFGVFSSGASDANTSFGVGNPYTLYGVTGNGAPGTTIVQSYVFDTATLSAAGVLTLGTGSSVPLPGALWLFGSGLLGLLGVSRRRTAA
jgi:hypothetical protein